MTAPERRPELLAALLRSLSRSHVGESVAPSPFPGGAALVDGSTGWVLPGERARASIGPALAWARQARVDALHVVVEGAEAAGTLARQAAAFASVPVVWRVDGAELVPAVPAPLPAPAPPPSAPDLEAQMVEAGLELVAGDGVLLGEVLGLEVARILSDEGGEPVMEVGIGRFDREVGAMVHEHLSPEERLARVVAVVTGERRPGAPPHPLNQLVPERWLRSALVAEPALVGAATLRAVPSVRERENLLAVGRATAFGHGPSGDPVVVVCSTGVDLDLVPGAADDRDLRAPGARLVLALPARDALPVTRTLAERLALPAEVVSIDGDWRIPWSSS